jgi:SAM-dependent methyltransferase
VNELGMMNSEMTEANNQEINIDELIQKIRNEVARHQNISPSLEIKPVTASSGTNTTSIGYIETLLNDADLYAQVPTEFPEKFTRFPFNFSKGLQKFLLKVYGFLFKKQRVVNSSLSQALRESLALNQRLVNQINSLQEQLNGIVNRVTVTEGRISEFNYHLSATNAGLADLGARVTVTEGRLVEMKHHLGATNEGVTEISDRLTSTEAEISDRLTSTEAEIENTNKQLEDIDERLTVMDESHLRNDSYIKNDLSQQKRLITMFLEEARQRLPEPFNSQQLQTFVNEEQHSLDALYVAFEERFRGSREVILNRLKVYLPLIAEVKIGTPESPILDVGCGRGEWLELLKESGYKASGIDISKVMLEQCQARGLEVREGDVISYLQSLPDASLGAVTGFHIIEHIPLVSLIKLFDEVIRVVKSGGIIIFETPNPRNVLVGSGDFYRDPTHLNPIHPDTISYIATLKGFINSESYFFEEKESGVELLPSSKMRFDKFDNYVTVSRDFVLIAHKP